jgi:hypothetical protein
MRADSCSEILTDADLEANMGWMTIIGLTIIALMAWILVKSVLTFAIPESISGSKYLRQQLSAHGIATANVPPAFFDEAIRWAQGIARVAELEKRGKFARKAEFAGALDTLAQMAALWRQDPDSPMFRSTNPGSYRALFEKYGI